MITNLQFERTWRRIYWEDIDAVRRAMWTQRTLFITGLLTRREYELSKHAHQLQVEMYRRQLRSVNRNIAIMQQRNLKGK